MGLASQIHDLYSRRNYSIRRTAQVSGLDESTVHSVYKKDNIKESTLRKLLSPLGYYPQFRIKPRGILCDLHLEKDNYTFAQEYELILDRLMITQTEVAKTLGVTKQALNKSLKNNNVKESDMIRYADAIDCDVICNFVRKPRD